MFTEKNSIYLIAGYVVFLGGMAIYLLSLYLRRRNVRRDEALLTQITEQMREEQTDSAKATEQR
ncbi:MAG TPA: hypothetical protein VGK87_01200 [Anaerolineae bacterium]|jgi:hypothetical protein